MQALTVRLMETLPITLVTSGLIHLAESIATTIRQQMIHLAVS